MNKITVDPKILAGKPVVAGTRIPVYLILNLLASGYNFDKIIEAYPRLTRADIETAIRYSEDRMKRVEVRSLSK
ncbi:MAG: DUF433 domain-containing protein [Patescibacteria group bacterium]